MSRIWRFGDDVDTDQIVPGRFAPYMTSEEELPKFAFVEARPEFASEVAPGDLIIAGENFGCGSSREYAPLALKRCRIGAIIACSFARIFYRNAVNIGLPLFELDATHLVDGDNAAFDLDAATIDTGSTVMHLPEPSELLRQAWEADGLVNLILNREDGEAAR